MLLFCVIVSAVLEQTLLLFPTDFWEKRLVVFNISKFSRFARKKGRGAEISSNRVDYVLKMILSVVCKNWSFTVQFSVISRRIFVFDSAHGQAVYRLFCEFPCSIATTSTTRTASNTGNVCFYQGRVFCKRRAPRVSSLKMRGVKRKAEQVLIDTKKVT